MIIKIRVYDRHQFTKYGKLKKKANAEYSRMMVDVEPHTEGATELFLKETATALRKEYEGFESPYIFTHLNARNKTTGEAVCIFEDVQVGNNDMMTSPVKLREYLIS